MKRLVVVIVMCLVIYGVYLALVAPVAHALANEVAKPYLMIGGDHPAESLSALAASR